MTVVSISFSSSSLVVDLDRLEVVQEHAVFESPSMFLLAVPVVWILGSSFRNRLILSYLAISSSICGLPQMILPFSWSIAFRRLEGLQGCQFYF